MMFIHPGRLLSFFLQADDGIRDGHVTGVQTCALPISFCEKSLYSIFRKMVEQKKTFSDVLDIYGFRIIVHTLPECYLRSEERRVGKECGGRRGCYTETRWNDGVGL